MVLLTLTWILTLTNQDSFRLIDHLSDAQTQSLTDFEQQIIALVNGSRAYGYDLELEKIGFKHFEFRSGGSPGADESAHWIKEQLHGIGLNASLEPFEFVTWNLTSKPTFVIDDDGNVNTTNDQLTMQTFLPAHLSWPTPPGDVFGDLVVLPLPTAANRNEIGLRAIDDAEWAVNTTGKVVLTGKEVGWSGTWLTKLNQKLSAQTPAAIIFTWWYDWMSFTPMVMSSVGGKSYWDWHLPAGFVDYNDGLQIRNRETAVNVSAYVSIRGILGTGTHYNVVGKISGFKNPEKYVIISSHYDTVVDAGFCDNGAGTAGVIELAKVMATAVQNGTYRPRYTLIFVTFADEEFGFVGAINYIKQHKAEMPNVVAVINMDCIGGDDFYYTETDAVGSFDLDSIVNRAAQDLGVYPYVELPGGSDQEPFLNPAGYDSYYHMNWGLDANISDAAPVPSSILLISEPVMYSRLWAMGKPGWIHTSYDNSTSTQTLDWVNASRLGDHIRIAALTVLRTSPMPGIPGDLDYNGVVDIYDGILLATAFEATPCKPDWNANADINDDSAIDIFDAIILANHFGQHLP